MQRRTLKLNAHRTLAYYAPEDVAALQAQLENVRAILHGCSFDLQLARQQRDAAYGMLRSVARAECMDEVREIVREFDDGYVGHG